MGVAVLFTRKYSIIGAFGICKARLYSLRCYFFEYLDRKKHCKPTYDYRASKLNLVDFNNGYEPGERLALLQAVRINESANERMGWNIEDFKLNTNESICINMPMPIIYIKKCYIYNENINMLVKTEVSEWVTLLNDNDISRTRQSCNSDYLIHNYPPNFVSLVISVRDDYAVIRVITYSKQALIFINDGTLNKTVKGRSLKIMLISICKKLPGTGNSSVTSSEIVYMKNLHRQRQLVITDNDGNYGDFNARSFCRKQNNSPRNPETKSSNNILFGTEKGRSLMITYKINKMDKPTVYKGYYKWGGNYCIITDFKYILLANGWQKGKHSCYSSSTISGSIRKQKGEEPKMVTKYAWEKLPWKMCKLCKQGIRYKNENTPSFKSVARIKGHIMKHGKKDHCVRLKWGC